MEYNRKDIRKLKEKLKENKKKPKENREEEENKDDEFDVFRRKNDTGTLYKSHMIRTAKAKGNSKDSYEKMMDRINKKGE